MINLWNKLLQWLGRTTGEHPPTIAGYSVHLTQEDIDATHRAARFPNYSPSTQCFVAQALTKHFKASVSCGYTVGWVHTEPPIHFVLGPSGTNLTSLSPGRPDFLKVRPHTFTLTQMEPDQDTDGL